MPTFIIPGRYLPIAAAGHAFTRAEIAAVLGGPFRVIVLREIGHAQEVLLVLIDPGDEPINTSASAIAGADAKGHAAAVVRGPAVHCMHVDGVFV